MWYSLHIPPFWTVFKMEYCLDIQVSTFTYEVDTAWYLKHPLIIKQYQCKSSYFHQTRLVKMDNIISFHSVRALLLISIPFFTCLCGPTVRNTDVWEKKMGRKWIKVDLKNPAYGRHWISRPMPIVGPIQFLKGL